MQRDVISSDGALYGKRCPLCKRKYKVGDAVLTYFHRVGALGDWVAWHVDCVRTLIDPPKPKRVEVTAEELAAFIAKETARIKARRKAPVRLRQPDGPGQSYNGR
jgi:hypothetical protein